jgi:exopolysaccharide biosynthesis WecB/TagA/CpsF family protein
MKDIEFPHTKTSGDLRFLELLTTATQEDLLNEVEDRLQNGLGFTVATLNLDHIVKLRSQPRFYTAYKQHSHVVADGNPIVWMSRLIGCPVKLVPGSELINPMAAIAARLNVPVGFIGSTQETLDKAEHALKVAYPDLQIVTKIAPPFGFDPTGTEASTYLEQVKKEGARICFLALGAPKQEILAARAGELVPNCGFVSIGAGLDFIAGSQSRAPRWVRTISMEWLWRMASNPTRLTGRYLACFVSFFRMSGEALVLKLKQTR